MPPARVRQGVGKAHDTARSSSYVLVLGLRLTRAHDIRPSSSQFHLPSVPTAARSQVGISPLSSSTSTASISTDAQGARSGLARSANCTTAGVLVLVVLCTWRRTCEMVADRAAPRQERSGTGLQPQPISSETGTRPVPCAQERRPCMHPVAASVRSCAHACVRTLLAWHNPPAPVSFGVGALLAGVALTQS